MYMDLLKESLSLKIFPPWWYFARNNSIYFSPSSKDLSQINEEICPPWHMTLRSWQNANSRTRFFYVSDKFKGQGCSSLPVRCTRGHSLRSKITLSKVLFLTTREIRQNFSRIKLKRRSEFLRHNFYQYSTIFF